MLFTHVTHFLIVFTTSYKVCEMAPQEVEEEEEIVIQLDQL